MIRYDGLDARALERLTGAPLVVLERSIPSTQDALHALAAGGAPSGSVVLADEQTAGRGRQGRTWHSPGGRGVWMSVLHRPAPSPASGALAVRAGLALLEAVREATGGAPAQLKWPNDLMVADRKAGGVLCEARRAGPGGHWVATGIGVNVSGPVAPAVRDLAVALGDVSPGLSRLGLLAALVPRLVGLGSLPPALSEEERRAFLLAEWREPDGERTVDLAPDGARVVRLASGALDRRVAAT